MVKEHKRELDWSVPYKDETKKKRVAKKKPNVKAARSFSQVQASRKPRW